MKQKRTGKRRERHELSRAKKELHEQMKWMTKNKAILTRV